MTQDELKAAVAKAAFDYVERIIDDHSGEFILGVGTGSTANLFIVEPEKLEKGNDLLWTWCARRPVSVRRHERGCSAQKRSQVPATQHSTVLVATPKGMPRQSTTRAIYQLQHHK